MNETRKMNQIRRDAGYDAYFCGVGIDIGCGPDILDANVFPSITSVQPYDRQHGNAESCFNLSDNAFDFVYSSHCLEHLSEPNLAIRNWIRICKPGGHIVFAVPHEVYYEKLVWPSRYNGEHRWSFRLEAETSMPRSILMPEFLRGFNNVEIVSQELYLVNFDFSRFWEDQTLGDAIVQIEVVLRKMLRQ